MNSTERIDLHDLIDRVAVKKDISVTIFITGDSTHISVYPHPDPEEGTKNPVAEAYRALVAGDSEEAIGYLAEALDK